MKNKKIIFTATICLSLIFNAPAFSKTVEEMNLGIKKIQDDWADAKYVAKTKDEKIAGLEKCAAAGAELSAAFPDRAEPIIWNGICLASQGELLKMSALPKVKAAKALFEKAAKINDKALDGSAYTNLAVLYQRVPGWPIGFGDDKLAEEKFQKDLAIAPKNIDANYFYALFLMEQKKFDEAQNHLDLALVAPSRNRPLADSKRKEEIEAAIIKLKNLRK
jgi:tetratricopeptide (TPR) repeat protein